MTLLHERLRQHQALLIRDSNRLDSSLEKLQSLTTKQILRLYVVLCLKKEEDPRRLNYLEEKVNSLNLNEDQKKYLEFLVSITYSSSSSGGNNG
jgi:hypothetical protein